MSKRAYTLFLQDILASILKIDEFIEGLNFNEFSTDEKTREAVVRKLEIIGEAARNLPNEFRDKYPQIPWEKMISMRNKMLHEYFGVDEEILWQTITEDLPLLKKQLQNLPEISA